LLWEQTQEKLKQDGALGAGGFFKRKRIDDLKFLERIAKSRRSSDLGEVARDLTSKRR
jgi:hypothetical protein